MLARLTPIFPVGIMSNMKVISIMDAMDNRVRDETIILMRGMVHAMQLRVNDAVDRLHAEVGDLQREIAELKRKQPNG